MSEKQVTVWIENEENLSRVMVHPPLPEDVANRIANVAQVRLRGVNVIPITPQFDDRKFNDTDPTEFLAFKQFVTPDSLARVVIEQLTIIGYTVEQG